MKDDPTLINRVILPSNRLPVPKLKLNMNEKVGKTIPTSCIIRKTQVWRKVSKRIVLRSFNGFSRRGSHAMKV